MAKIPEINFVYEYTSWGYDPRAMERKVITDTITEHFGKDGWELVSVTVDKTEYVTFWFKRMHMVQENG